MRPATHAATAALACALALAGSSRAASLEDYGALPAVDHLVISPDGARIAYVVPDNGRQGVVVASLEPAALITGVNGTGQKIRELAWADPDHLLIMKSQAGYALGVDSRHAEWTMANVLDVAKRKAGPLLDADADGNSVTSRADGVRNESAIMNVIAGSPQARAIGGRTVIYVRGIAFVDGRSSPALFSVDLSRRKQATVETALASTQDRDWLVDAQGELLAQTTYDETAQRWALRLRRKGGWQEVYSTHATIDTPGVEGLSPDGAALIVSQPSDEGYGFKALSLKDGTMGPAPEAFTDLAAVMEDPASHRIIGGVHEGMETRYQFFDAADQAAWTAVENSFPGEEVELVSWTRDRRKVIVTVTGQAHGVAYVLVDLEKRKAIQIADAYAGITAADVAVVQTIAYKAADGRSIAAYLTLPNGREAKGLPLIVLPHGGPAARDGSGFDWWAQALASRGYAVLQPQFRGSAGLGWDLLSVGFGQWGRKMQTDLSDGVRALGHAGIVDPKRVCIAGGSYGGYAAMAGVTMQSGVYRCAVSVAGVSDLHKLLGGRYADAALSRSLRWMDRFVGSKDPNDPVLDQISPIRFADKLSVPLLLIHGEDDTVVPIEQSRRMADALKAAGKPFEFVTLKSEDHWLSRSETRIRMLQATVKFLEANNPPG